MKARFVKAGLICTDKSLLGDERTTLVDGRLVWIVGSVVDHPEAYKLVRLGVCVPADEECVEAAGMTEEQMQAAQWAHERVRRGIQPEDYERFDSGEIEGYRSDGSEIPGPNSRSDIQSGRTSNGGVFIP